MLVNNVNNLQFAAPEVATFEIDHVPATHQEWSSQLETLDLKTLFGSLALGATFASHPEESYTMARHPDEGERRDWWAGDHLLHVDGTRWKVQPDFTVIACRVADLNAPTTELVDTVRLLDITLEDGFWREHGFEEKDLDGLLSIFTDSTYQREALPFLKSLMDDDDQAVVSTIIEQDLEVAGCSSLDEYLEKLDEANPPKHFDLIRSTPLSKKRSLFIDGGGRNSTIIDEAGDERTDVLHALRLEYLTGQTPKELGILKSVSWTANSCLIFPQTGTLHRANPGNTRDRELHLGFLSSIQQN